MVRKIDEASFFFLSGSAWIWNWLHVIRILDALNLFFVRGFNLLYLLSHLFCVSVTQHNTRTYQLNTNHRNVLVQDSVHVSQLFGPATCRINAILAILLNWPAHIAIYF